MGRFDREDVEGSEFDQAKAFLEAEFAKSRRGTSIVVTHHGPSQRSVLSRFKNDLVALPSYPLESTASGSNGAAAPSAIQPAQAPGELLLTNAGVFENTIAFFDYAKARGFRATPHLD